VVNALTSAYADTEETAVCRRIFQAMATPFMNTAAPPVALTLACEKVESMARISLFR
jgi:hypothetical protein